MAQAIKHTWPALAILMTLLAAARADDITLSRCDHFPYTGSKDSSDYVGALFLNRCHIKEITTSDLQNLTNVTLVFITNNEIEHLDSSVLAAIPKTTRLDISNNKLKYLPNFGANSVLPNLEILTASHNSISKLDDPKTFSSTKQLGRLSLDHNQIQYIHPDIFAGLERLRSIDFENNKLTFIDDKMFSLPSLRFVRLGNNLIENMAAGAFRGSMIFGLYLEGNKLTHLPDDLFAGPGTHIVNFCYEHNPWRHEQLTKFLTREIERNMTCPIKD